MWKSSTLEPPDRVILFPNSRIVICLGWRDALIRKCLPKVAACSRVLKPLAKTVGRVSRFPQKFPPKTNEVQFIIKISNLEWSFDWSRIFLVNSWLTWWLISLYHHCPGRRAMKIQLFFWTSHLFIYGFNILMFQIFLSNPYRFAVVLCAAFFVEKSRTCHFFCKKIHVWARTERSSRTYHRNPRKYR